MVWIRTFSLNFWCQANGVSRTYALSYIYRQFEYACLTCDTLSKYFLCILIYMNAKTQKYVVFTICIYEPMETPFNSLNFMNFRTISFGNNFETELIVCCMHSYTYTYSTSMHCTLKKKSVRQRQTHPIFGACRN